MPKAIRERIRAVAPAASLRREGDNTIVVTTFEGHPTELSLNRETTPGGRTWWILSDLDDDVRDHPVRADHVMGVGGATRSLLSALPEGTVGQALDLGTGNGIVALHLSTMAQQVVATDVSPRAIWIARLNAQINGVDSIDFRVGDLFEPLQGERFDLVATNPPFVIAPSSEPGVLYRSSREPGDALMRRLLDGVADILEEDGVCIALANWERVGGETPWIEQGAPRGCSAWLIERGIQAPGSYVGTWLRDGGLLEGAHGYRQAFETWIRDFQDRNVTGVSFGYLKLRRTTPSMFRCERVPNALGTKIPFGRAWAEAFESLRQIHHLDDRALLDLTMVRHEDVEEVRVLTPGTDVIRRLSLAKASGIERVIDADTIVAAFVGACDGELSLGQIADAIATLLNLGADSVRERTVRAARELVAAGMLVPVINGYT